MMRSESGLSLISALWITTVLSVLATQFLYSIRLEQRTQANFADRTKYYYAAKAGVEMAIAYLRADETDFDSLGEIWAQPITNQIDDGIQIGRMLIYEATIVDEGAKANINTMDSDTLNRLLEFVGYQQDVNLGEEEQTLAQQIEAAKPFRTIPDLGRIEGMTEQLLYGDATVTTQTVSDFQPAATTTGTNAFSSANGLEQGVIGGLANYITVYSTDKNTSADGQQRVNINQADAEQIRQIEPNGQTIFEMDEAEAVIGGRSYDDIGDLLDASAVSDELFDQIRDRISIDSEEDSDRININTADEEKLRDLDGIEDGISARIVAHRDQNGEFDNVDQLKEIKLITEDEFRNIVDRITVVEGETIEGLININTAPAEVLLLLPNMTGEIVQAIITRRETPPEEPDPSLEGIEGNPFRGITDLLEIEGINMNIFKEIAGRVTFRSHGFIITGLGIDANGKTVAKCDSVISRSGSEIQFKQWRYY